MQDPKLFPISCLNKKKLLIYITYTVYRRGLGNFFKNYTFEISAFQKILIKMSWLSRQKYSIGGFEMETSNFAHKWKLQAFGPWGVH